MIKFLQNHFQNPVKKIQNSKKEVILSGAEPSEILENELENVINLLFKNIYKPLAKLLVEEGIADTQKDVLNSEFNLLQAIKNNQLLYDGSGFVYTKTYKANTNLTKELQTLGAVFNNKQKKWFINASVLPDEVILAINQIQAMQYSLATKLGNYTNQLNSANVILLQEFKTKFKEIYYNIIENVIKQNKQNLTAEGIAIKLKFDDVILEQIASEYTNNLQLYINTFTQEQITQLRQIVSNNVDRGLRKENLIQEIQERFDVSKSKAKFLARQETSLLTANIQKQNMLRAGIEYYVWDSSRDRKVRPDHAVLNGKIFRFDNPPIVNQKTGARANAGEDFACRCVSRPLLINIDKLKPFYENGYTYYKVVN